MKFKHTESDSALATLFRKGMSTIAIASMPFVVSQSVNAQIINQAGVGAYATGSVFERVTHLGCDFSAEFCGPYPLNSFSRSDGVLTSGQNSAEVDFGKGIGFGTPSNDTSFLATSSFDNNGNPILRAKAVSESFVTVFENSPYAHYPLVQYDYDVYASAYAVQRFTYRGFEESNYGLTFNLHGEIGCFTCIINGGVALFDGVATSENPFGSLLSANGVTIEPGSGGPNFSFTLSTHMANGQSFYLFMSLESTAAGLDCGFGCYQTGFADASHTFTMEITSGDPRLLQAAITSATTAVPEPETYAMLLAGLGFLGFAARRKRRQA